MAAKSIHLATERLLDAAKAAYLMQGVADPRLAPVFEELGEAISEYETGDAALTVPPSAPLIEKLRKLAEESPYFFHTYASINDGVGKETRFVLSTDILAAVGTPAGAQETP